MFLSYCTSVHLQVRVNKFTFCSTSHYSERALAHKAVFNNLQFLSQIPPIHLLSLYGGQLYFYMYAKTFTPVSKHTHSTDPSHHRLLSLVFQFSVLIPSDRPNVFSAQLKYLCSVSDSHCVSYLVYLSFY